MKIIVLLILTTLPFITFGQSIKMPLEGKKNIKVYGGETFYDTGGELSPYSNDQSSIISFQSTVGTIIQVTFTSFKLEESYDFLKAFDSDTNNNALTTRISGNKFPVVTSTGRNITFKFTSDYSEIKKGWIAQIIVIKKSSKELAIWLKADKGLIINKNWNSQTSNSGVNFYGNANQKPSLGKGLNFNPSLYFDGNDVLFGSSEGFYTNDYFVVFKAKSEFSSKSPGMSIIDAIGINNPEPDENIAGISIGSITSAFANEIITHGVGTVNKWRSVKIGNTIYKPIPYIINAKDNRTSKPSNTKIFLNGRKINNSSKSNFLSESNRNYYIGARGDAKPSLRTYYTGDIAEILVFRKRQSSDKRKIIQSYLALKYGISLGNKSTPINYFNSDGKIVWQRNSKYQNNVFGIAKDKKPYNLDQRVSSSENLALGESSKITFSTSDNFTNSNLSSSRTPLSEGQYLICGDNNLAVNNWIKKGAYKSVSRKWKIKNTGNVSNVNIQIDLSSYPSTQGTYIIILDSDQNIANGIISSHILVNNGGDLYKTSFTPPPNTSYFTVGHQNSNPIINSFSPTTLCTSKTVTINGNNFKQIRHISFNGKTTTTSFTIINERKIEVVVPYGATTGRIEITTNSGIRTTSKIELKVNNRPLVHGIISGTNFLIPGSTYTFNCNSIPNIINYSWVFSNQDTILTTTNRLVYTVPLNESNESITLTVVGINDCGIGPISRPFYLNIIPNYTCQSEITNWNFNLPILNNQNWKIYSTVNGWESDPYGIEIWKGGFLGANTVDGGQLCELNSAGPNRIWQNISTVPGARMFWSILYQYRNSMSESLMLQIGVSGELVDIKTISNNDTGWILHSGYYTVPVGQTQTQFSLQSISAGGTGNLIDDIKFYTIDPDIEKPVFEVPNTISLCSSTQNLVVFNLAPSNISDNCTATEDILIEYKVSNQQGDLISRYGDDNDGDASGYSFPYGKNILTYKISDKAGNYSEKEIIINILNYPKPIGLLFD